VIVWHENGYKRASLYLLDEGVSSLSPYGVGPDHRINGHAQPLLRAVGCIIDITAGGTPDHEDIEVVRRRARLLQVSGSPRAEDKHLLRARQSGEFIGHDLQWPPRKEQELGQRANVAIARIRLDQSRSPDVAPTQQARVSEALHLPVNRAERCMESPRKVGQAALRLGVEEQGRKNVSLQLRPEHRKQRGRLTSHRSKISSV
jgi:hypothetical protein